MVLSCTTCTCGPSPARGLVGFWPWGDRWESSSHGTFGAYLHLNTKKSSWHRWWLLRSPHLLLAALWTLQLPFLTGGQRDPGNLLLYPVEDCGHNLERKEHVLRLTGSWEVLSVVFHSQTSSGLCGRTGRASPRMWHRGLGCKIYPAWQLVKELCNSHQLTETTVRCSLE